MKIMIDIEEKRFRDIQRISTVQLKGRTPTLEQVIAHGRLLPNGHGRIGDLDALREEVSSWGMNDYEPSDFIDAIDQADTIIEADNEESKEKE